MDGFWILRCLKKHFPKKIQNLKIKLKKDPLKFQKVKSIYKEASNQKVLENRPPKSGNSDAKYKFEIFKKPKIMADILDFF